MARRIVQAGMHIFFVVALPISLVAFSIQRPTGQPGNTEEGANQAIPRVGDTLMVTVNGNTIASTTIPSSTASGTLILHYAGTTCSLAVDTGYFQLPQGRE